MWIRITKTVRDPGQLVPPDQLFATVKDKTKDWYYSPFYYDETALEYFKGNGNSLAGFDGKVFTDTLYWDIDIEDDLEKAREQAIRLCMKLEELGFSDGIEVYFSGSKGFHILLRTTNQFNPQETSKICYNVAHEANCLAGFDTVVYNTNRIFRIPNTRHQDSGLYKIPLTHNELANCSIKKILKLAKKIRKIPTESKTVDASILLKRFGKFTDNKNVTALKVYSNGATKLDDVDMSAIPKGIRRCNYRLEQGMFGPGERENGCTRIAAYCKSRGLDRDQTKAIVITALDRRAQRYPDAEEWQEKDVDRIVDTVYSENHRGGYYTCKPGMKQDTFLVSHCDMGEGCCARQAEARIMTMGIESLVDAYIKYGAEALPEYPKFGIKFIDDNVRLRPRNFGVLNGANGSGKTSLVTQLMDNLNKQKLHHIFFSADMADSSLFEKLASRYTRFTQFQIEDAFSKYSTAENAQEIREEVIAKLNIALPYTIFDFTATLRTEYIKETIQTTEAVSGIKLSLAIVDYAGRMTNDFESAYQKATQNALQANTISKECNVHLLIVSQVSREHGDHTIPLRTSRVAKESGAWEENATYVMNVWRPVGFDPLQDKYIHIFIGKNRGPGVSAEHVMHWEGKEGSMRELSDNEFADYKELIERLKEDNDNKHRRLLVPFRDGFQSEDALQEQINKDRRFAKNDESEDTKITHGKKKSVQRSKRPSRFTRDN